MKDLIYSIKVIALSSLVLMLSSAVPPESPCRIDALPILILYAAFRFEGWERLLWFMILALLLHSHTIFLQEGIVIALALSGGLLSRRLFKRLYVDSYALESLYVTVIIFIGALMRHLFLPFSLHAFAILAVQTLVNAIATFIILLLFDLAFHRSHALWRRV